MRTTLSQHAYQYGWDRSREPVITIRSGDEIALDLQDASDGQIRAGDDATIIDRLDRKRMNPLVGPILVEGAHPGCVLEVEIRDVRPATYGWTAVFPRFGLLADDFPDAALLTWSVTDGVAETAGLRLHTAPSCGVIGVVPEAPGAHSVVPPRNVGGNLDTKQLVAGARLYLPVEVEGALLGIGDAHALQGDGEVCGTALEVSAHAEIRVTVRDDLRVSSPAFATPLGPQAGPWFATTGVEPDLYNAARAAVRRMIEHLGREYGLAPSLAYMLCSLVVDLRISEVVDRPNWVVSALLPTTALS